MRTAANTAMESRRRTALAAIANTFHLLRSDCKNSWIIRFWELVHHWSVVTPREHSLGDNCGLRGSLRGVIRGAGRLQLVVLRRWVRAVWLGARQCGRPGCLIRAHQRILLPTRHVRRSRIVLDYRVYWHLAGGIVWFLPIVRFCLWGSLFMWNCSVMFVRTSNISVIIQIW